MPTSNIARSVLVLLGLGMSASVGAQPATDQPAETAAVQSPNEILKAARMALQAGAHQRAADLLTPLLSRDSSIAKGDEPGAALDRADRAEAWRIYGLSLYFLERYEPARLALLEHLKLDYDARLDPALWPPELVAFFEDVRARNAAELLKYKPRSGKRRSIMLNLVPPLGQFQNGHRTKGVIVGSLGILALASNVGSYLALLNWCNTDTDVCQTDAGESREGQAKIMRTVNLAASAVLAGVIAYGIIDGFANYRRERPSITVSWMPVSGGVGIAAGARF